MDAIKDYLVKNCGMNEFFAMQLVAKFKNHADIMNEFIDYTRTHVYKGAKSGEWTAKALSEKLPHLDANTIFEFMVGLRDEPEKYEGYIRDGAPIL